ncbi:MAG: hypothetical protein A3J38_09575 [Gammaproteobacteria bacterium RIFCSPHIGHO2_12_FULL_45_9]|nr:MAG: hypothetical protein A3J38_09575 [Gammaproteobacteria bacterium RIFCSPHIGHO2_12_FULL_45_9]
MRTNTLQLPASLQLTTLFSGVLSVRVTRVLVSVLVLSVFVSALALVYVKDLNRRLFMGYQAAQRVTTQQTVLWGKDLLVASAFYREERVQSIASQQLEMAQPTAVNTVLLSLPASDT